jgi:hypothetical protein
MADQPVVPKGEALRRAIAWLVGQGAWSLDLVEQACQRFDLSPAEEEFLIRELRQFHAPSRKS